MSTTRVHKDPDALTMTVTTTLDATAERAWRLWADPRQLERWWGPPGYPATFVDHALTVGTRTTYYMTSPEGEKFYGFWEIVAVDPPRRLEVLDGFADSDGNPDESMPAGTMIVTFDEHDGTTEMAILSYFTSLEAMEQLLAMGQEQGMVAALTQIDAILADPAFV